MFPKHDFPIIELDRIGDFTFDMHEIEMRREGGGDSVTHFEHCLIAITAADRNEDRLHSRLSIRRHTSRF